MQVLRAYSLVGEGKAALWTLVALRFLVERETHPVTQHKDLSCNQFVAG